MRHKFTFFLLGAALISHRLSAQIGRPLGTVVVSALPQPPTSAVDHGVITIVVNGDVETAAYGPYSTPSSVASGLAAKLNLSCSGVISARTSGPVIKLYEIAGDETTASVNSSVTYDTADFAHPSFQITIPPKALVSLTSLSVSATKAVVGSPVTLTAYVSSPPVTGLVTFNDGSTNLGTAQLTGGYAVLTVGSFTQGTHNLSATFPGDAVHSGSTSDPVSFTGLVLTPTVTLLSSAHTPSLYGDTLSIEAAVNPSTASGSVIFMDGNNIISTAPLTGTGIVSVATALLNVGNHSLTATYSGDQLNASSASAPLDQVVLPQGSALPAAVVYSYSIAEPGGGTGYLANGNISDYTDSLNGTWSLGYDNLNRIATGAVIPSTSSPAGYQTWCWQYDSFGNRLVEANATTAFQGGGATPCASSTSGLITVLSYDAANHLISDPLTQYDSVGRVTRDPDNSYLYDGDGHICAVKHTIIAGIAQMTQYIYDADGRRVAKGMISSFNCDSSSNGFTVTNSYALGQGGEQITEMLVSATGQSSWAHTNAIFNGALVATYDPQGLHFHIADWLGSRRVQTDALGEIEETCTNLPFGNGLQCAAPSSTLAVDDATEHHYTGKERDTESGLDYFGARYYASSMGRWMSPDDGSDQDPSDPQSWNLYSYVRNNPLKFIDPSGRDCVYLNDAGNAAESVDQHSSQTECMGDGKDNKGTGGYWVDGHADTLYTDPNSNAVALTGLDKQGLQTSSPIYNSATVVNVNATDSTQIGQEQLYNFYLLPANMHFASEPVVRYSPWQMVKRMFNCWAMDDPNARIAPKPPEAKASTDTVPNSASNLNTVRTSKKYGPSYGPQLGNPHAAEGMGTAADAAGMQNDINNCAGGR